jgi:hypothetical protein
MRTFHLQRVEDVSGVSGTGRVAEGVVFSNGLVALTWLSEHPTVSVYPSLAAVEAVHGHAGRTQVVVDAGPPSTLDGGANATAIGRSRNGRRRGRLAGVGVSVGAGLRAVAGALAGGAAPPNARPIP